MIIHDIDDVFAVADRVVVLRLGRVVHEGPVPGDPTRLVHLMAGLTGTRAPDEGDGHAATGGTMAPAGAS